MRYTQQEMAAKGGAHIPMSHKAVKEVAKLRQLLQEERKLSLRSKETTDAKLAAANKKTASFQRQLQNLTQPKHAKRAPDPHKPELHSIKEGGMTSEESDETVDAVFAKVEEFMETKRMRIKVSAIRRETSKVSAIRREATRTR
jgi:hypothetical protein